MSFIPDLQLGLWNAWILVLPLIANLTLQARVAGVRERGGKGTLDSLSKKERRLLAIYQVSISASFVYSVFLPLKLGTAWFYVGVCIYLAGIFVSAKAISDFTTTPKDTLVTKGVYRVSRNPMYVGWSLMYIAMGIATTSWSFLLLTMLLIILQDILLVTEERWCLEKYGSAYQEYMNRTPKWIGVPKSDKKDP